MANPNYTQTITVYNCLKAVDAPDKKERWLRTVLPGCFFKSQAAVITSTGATGPAAQLSNTYTVRIPEDPKYLPYRQWAELPEEERAGRFTLDLGDMIVAGECLEEVDRAASFLQRHKPAAFKVSAVSDNTRFPFERHYRAGG